MLFGMTLLQVIFIYFNCSVNKSITVLLVHSPIWRLSEKGGGGVPSQFTALRPGPLPLFQVGPRGSDTDHFPCFRWGLEGVILTTFHTFLCQRSWKYWPNTVSPQCALMAWKLEFKLFFFNLEGFSCFRRVSWWMRTEWLISMVVVVVRVRLAPPYKIPVESLSHTTLLFMETIFFLIKIWRNIKFLLLKVQFNFPQQIWKK